MKRRSGFVFAIACLLLSTLVLSGQTCDEGTAGQCVPGRIVPCPCPDGSDGLQECKEDNTYGECACFDAGGTQDASGDADGADAEGETLPYRYVKITDLSEEGSTETAGADIDAIELVKESGESYWANQVERSDLPSSHSLVDVNEMLGINDAVSTDGSTCNVDTGYVSLGGDLSFAVVSFESNAVLEPGDTIRVYEVGNCDFGAGTANAEEIRIQVGTTADGEIWSLVANASGQSPIHAYLLSSDQLPPVTAD